MRGNKIVGFRADKQTEKLLKDLAKNLGTSISGAIRYLIAKASKGGTLKP